ncbi:MAG: NAD-dependent epimerase/dehydratase family protein [Treponema sp.]|nr:NAD-dependent epimerase/dehydratase family protein [Treponema sp.]
MKKNILAIGGSAFTGRAFSMECDHEAGISLQVVNRGNLPLNLSNVREYRCDRRDPERLAALLPQTPLDAIVDFCGYLPGDVRMATQALAGRFRQYIFVSTVNVYENADRKPKAEGDPVAEPSGGNPVADYIGGKIRLEQELKDVCAELGAAYTILRPTFIYGPFNYAPRESWFIEQIARGRPIPMPADASSQFQFVYVRDVALAAIACAGDSRAYNEVFNLAAPEEITYTRLLSELERCNGKPFETYDVTVQEVLQQNLPLPFPLTAEENELYSGEKFAATFDFQYTDFSQGMEKTFQAFYSSMATH